MGKLEEVVSVSMSLKKLSFVKINDNNTTFTKAFEILSIEITKPGLRHMFISCLCRPPMGSNKIRQDFFKNMISINNSEIWILGNFNVV